MRVLVLGSGGREHALGWALSRDVTVLFFAPGNPGTATLGTNVPLDPCDPSAVVDFAEREHIELVVVGPEAPLVAGVADALIARGVLCFGHDKSAASLEGSKALSKTFMARHAIPTAAFEVHTDADVADAAIDRIGAPIVIKADGLAAGKGVIVASTLEEAHQAVDAMMRKATLGKAGQTVVLEQCLVGVEASYHFVTDGESYQVLPAAQDHKRLLDGDKGPNTGGMGAYAPPPLVDSMLEQKIIERLVKPTLAGARAERLPLRGVVFLGVMVVEGEPYLLEYNMRMGDPETEALVMLLQSSFLDLAVATARGTLGACVVKCRPGASMAVVLAASGYPAAPQKGAVITDHTRETNVDVLVFHAGTRQDGSELVVSGGRVLVVTAYGTDIKQAATLAYARAGSISFAGKQLRRDIGWQARGESES